MVVVVVVVLLLLLLPPPPLLLLPSPPRLRLFGSPSARGLPPLQLLLPYSLLPLLHLLRSTADSVSVVAVGAEVRGRV